MRPEGVSGSAIGRARGIAERLAEVYERTAAVLEQSAALAEIHAERLVRAGRSQAAQDEQRTAEWARKAAQRAREAASDAREAGAGSVARRRTTRTYYRPDAECARQRPDRWARSAVAPGLAGWRADQCTVMG
jgi:hypothetical protein